MSGYYVHLALNCSSAAVRASRGNAFMAQQPFTAVKPPLQEGYMRTNVPLFVHFEYLKIIADNLNLNRSKFEYSNIRMNIQSVRIFAYA